MDVIDRAKILLKADDGLTDVQISEPVGCSIGTPYNTRKAYAERGIAAIHRRKANRVYERKLDGRAEAHLIALACSDPPEGRSRWSLHLLAEHLVALNEMPPNVSTDRFLTQRPSVRRSLRGNAPETRMILSLTGSSQLKMPASNSGSCIQQITIEAALE